MRLSLFILASSLLLSCNNIPEAILLANTEKVDTLDVNEYTHVIDKKKPPGLCNGRKRSNERALCDYT